MNLSQLNLTNSHIAALKKAEWTVETIATATPARLAKVPGIGLVSAKAIVGKAQKIVNDEKLIESKMVEYSQASNAPVEKSVRIRRIEASQK